MATKTLEDLFHDTLQDIYYAEQQILKKLPELAEAAGSNELTAAFEKHTRETQGHVTRLEEIFATLGKPARAKRCDGIEGILAEGDSMAKEFTGTAALDAALISAAQAVEHYEITRYGTLRRWAQMLGMPQVADLLNTTLDEESRTDDLLTRIADTQANIEANV